MSIVGCSCKELTSRFGITVALRVRLIAALYQPLSVSTLKARWLYSRNFSAVFAGLKCTNATYKRPKTAFYVCVIALGDILDY